MEAVSKSRNSIEAMKEFQLGFNKLVLNKEKLWTKNLDGNAQEQQEISLPSYIRNCIHHPENKENEIYNELELRKSLNIFTNFTEETT